VRQFIIKWPEFVEVNRLFGSLADGPLWVWGPNGPIPVDPWGPKYVKEAEKLQKEMLNVLTAMKRLGLSVYRERLDYAAKQAGEVVLEEDEEFEEREKSNGTKAGAKK
jgi:hypothetical protein